MAGVSAAGAAALYRAASAAPTEAGAGAGAGVGAGAAVGGGTSFGQALTRAMEHGVDLGRQSDVTSTQALTGQGSVTDVVLAVGRAELALQTAVAVRDRMVSAYQDIMRMPV